MIDGRSTLTECYVAFLDLMGVRNLVKEATEDVDLCSKVVAALEETKNISSFFHEKREVATGDVTRWTLQVQAFSDCVVMFVPTECQMLAWLLASIRRLHDRLVRLNIPIRGGITIGEMHWDKRWDNQHDDESMKVAPVAFGPGLVAAYDLENATAVYPRILISSALLDHVEGNPKIRKSSPYGTGNLLDFFRQDSDGLYHLDVLHANVNRRDVIGQPQTVDENGSHVTKIEFDETPYGEWLEVVRQFIENGIDNSRGEKVASKYLWLANYYNEKAQQAKGTLIHRFDKLIPDGAIKVTEKRKEQASRIEPK